nr:uncharacterized protein LOC126534079 isoform X3 [Dermacentor andersoni]
MAKTQLFAALLVTGFVTLFKRIHGGYGGVFIAAPEMRKFVGTREPIWTYSETGKSLVRCKVDITSTMNNRAVLFRRMYSYEGQKYSTNQWGVFDNIYKERMVIRPAAPTRWYELRVRNSSIATGPHEDCLQEFTDVAYSRRIVYTPDCQRFALFDDVK